MAAPPGAAVPAVAFDFTKPCAAALATYTGADGVYPVAAGFLCPTQVTVIVAAGASLTLLTQDENAVTFLQRLRFRVEAGGQLSFRGPGAVRFTGSETLTFKDAAGDPGACGGAIYSAGDVVFATSVRFIDNSAQYGGAVCSVGGTVQFGKGALFTGSATQAGAALYMGAGSTVTFAGSNTNFIGNNAVRGGAIAIYGGTLTLKSDSTSFGENQVSDQGGAIYAYAGNTTLEGKVVFGNDAAANGGEEIWMGAAATMTFTDPGTTFSQLPDPQPGDIAGPGIGGVTGIPFLDTPPPSPAPTAATPLPTPRPTPLPTAQQQPPPPPSPAGGGALQASYSTTLVGQPAATFSDAYEQAFVTAVAATVTAVDGAAAAEVVDATWAAAAARRLLGGGCSSGGSSNGASYISGGGASVGGGSGYIGITGGSGGGGGFGGSSRDGGGGGGGGSGGGYIRGGGGGGGGSGYIGITGGGGGDCGDSSRDGGGGGGSGGGTHHRKRARALQSGSDVAVSYTVRGVDSATALDAVSQDLQQQSDSGALLAAYKDVVARTRGLSAARVTATGLTTDVLTSPSDNSSSGGGSHTVIIIACAVAGAALLAMAGVCVWWRRKRAANGDSSHFFVLSSGGKKQQQAQQEQQQSGGRAPPAEGSGMWESGGNGSDAGSSTRPVDRRYHYNDRIPASTRSSWLAGGSDWAASAAGTAQLDGPRHDADYESAVDGPFEEAPLPPSAALSPVTPAALLPPSPSAEVPPSPGAAPSPSEAAAAKLMVRGMRIKFPALPAEGPASERYLGSTADEEEGFSQQTLRTDTVDNLNDPGAARAPEPSATESDAPAPLQQPPPQVWVPPAIPIRGPVLSSSQGIDDNAGAQSVPDAETLGVSAAAVAGGVATAVACGGTVEAWQPPQQVAACARGIRGLCDEVISLFGAMAQDNKNFNCREVVRWASDVQSALDALQDHLDKQHPDADSAAVDVTALTTCQQRSEELVRLARVHRSTGMLAQFARSRRAQALIAEASQSLSNALRPLQPSLRVKTPRATLRIDETVSSLLSAMDDQQVHLGAFASGFGRRGETAAAAADDPSSSLGSGQNFKFKAALSSAAQALDADDSIHTSQDSSGTAASSSRGSDGPDLASPGLPEVIESMQVRPTSFRRIDEVPIGRGGSALVYKVEHLGQVRAAKVLRLGDLLPEQLQKVYIKFTKELYILATLRHPRVVEVVGCAASATEMTILMEYMMRGSLRRVLSDEHVWQQQFTPTMRHQVLCDIAEGMLFLHDNRVHHGDLKSQNVLITDWGRAKLTDFGLSRTTDAVSSFTGRSTLAGGTVAWMAPEAFSARRRSAEHCALSDVYSYAIVTWEVLAGAVGGDAAIPWCGLSIVDVIAAVAIRGERPPLPPGCVSDANVAGAARHDALMRRCWAAMPADRPPFREIVASIGGGGTAGAPLSGGGGGAES